MVKATGVLKGRHRRAARADLVDALIGEALRLLGHLPEQEPGEKTANAVGLPALLEVNGGLLPLLSCPRQRDGAGAELSGVGAGHVRQPFVKAVSQPAELEPERRVQDRPVTQTCTVPPACAQAREEARASRWDSSYRQ
ncbi:hypothetical protein [Streptomyces cadmiisoli]|uniref:hypothetical protein n=1 Tax=Streptomyces cadmiisoli TaxID=2184053 RepID=UPI0013A70290|nr:hypothetical protein [Streptomyces cadmiisoli]